MSFLDDLLVTKRLSLGDPNGSPIVLDASIREVHNVEGELTEHPVEDGADISDHYRVLPRLFELEGVVSDTPIVGRIPGASLISSAVGLIQGDERPSINAWEELNRFFDEKVVVEITSSLQVYPSMVLTSLSVTRSAGQSGGLFFTATARQIEFVATEEGAALPAVTTGQKAKSAGKATNTAANGAEQTKSSALLKGFQGLGLMQ